jgi:hypothetical protein
VNGSRISRTSQPEQSFAIMGAAPVSPTGVIHDRAKSAPAETAVRDRFPRGMSGNSACIDVLMEDHETTFMSMMD